MTIEAIERASSADVSERFGFYYDEALARPLAVERNGAEGVLMMAATEYERLARLDHVALHSSELDQADLKALRDVVISERARELDNLLD